MLGDWLIDPNIVYVILVLGLWIGVTAVLIPGTGVAEGLAVAGLGVAGLMLLNMPTNWLAVLLLVVGVLGFIVMPFLDQRYGWLALAGLALQGAGGLLLFNEGMQVSPLVIVFTLAIPYAYHSYILMPMLHRMREKATHVDRDSAVVGSMGRVIKALNPVGTVQAAGELWTASTPNRAHVEAGVEVVVLEREGLQLSVEPLKRKVEEVSVDAPASEAHPNGQAQE